MAKTAASPKKPNAAKNLPSLAKAEPEEPEVPAQNIDIIREALGVDLTREPPDRIRQLAIAMRHSISTSPYPSPEMLAEYQNHGFPELVTRVIEAVDAQRNHRLAIETQKTNGTEQRLNNAQRNSMIIGCLGVLGALIGGYFHVPGYVCVAVVVVAVGGPNAATVLSRIMDKFNK